MEMIFFTIANTLITLGAVFYAHQAKRYAEQADIHEQNCFKRWLESGALDEPEDPT